MNLCFFHFAHAPVCHHVIGALLLHNWNTKCATGTEEHMLVERIQCFFAAAAAVCCCCYLPPNLKAASKKGEFVDAKGYDFLVHLLRCCAQTQQQQQICSNDMCVHSPITINHRICRRCCCVIKATKSLHPKLKNYEMNNRIGLYLVAWKPHGVAQHPYHSGIINGSRTRMLDIQSDNFSGNQSFQSFHSVGVWHDL